MRGPEDPNETRALFMRMYGPRRGLAMYRSVRVRDWINGTWDRYLRFPVFGLVIVVLVLYAVFQSSTIAIILAVCSPFIAVVVMNIIGFGLFAIMLVAHILFLLGARVSKAGSRLRITLELCLAAAVLGLIGGVVAAAPWTGYATAAVEVAVWKHVDTGAIYLSTRPANGNWTTHNTPVDLTARSRGYPYYVSPPVAVQVEVPVTVDLPDPAALPAVANDPDAADPRPDQQVPGPTTIGPRIYSPCFDDYCNNIRAITFTPTVDAVSVRIDAHEPLEGAPEWHRWDRRSTTVLSLRLDLDGDGVFTGGVSPNCVGYHAVNNPQCTNAYRFRRDKDFEVNVSHSEQWNSPWQVSYTLDWYQAEPHYMHGWGFRPQLDTRPAGASAPMTLEFTIPLEHLGPATHIGVRASKNSWDGYGDLRPEYQRRLITRLGTDGETWSIVRIR